MKKIMIGIATIALTLFGAIGLIACSGGRTFELDGWTLFEQNGRVNIISANSESLVIDGVLVIPASIGTHDIYGFGRPSKGMFGSDSGASFEISENLASIIVRFVIAEEVFVDDFFYHNFSTIFGADATVYVEFLSTTFERIQSTGGGGVNIVCIIPDGSTQNFIAKNPNALLYPGCFIEKSDFLGEAQEG